MTEVGHQIQTVLWDRSDDGFFLACEDFEGRIDDLLPARAFFFTVEISSGTTIPLV